MTLNQLRAFVAAQRLGSFTAAATHLGIAQASVSELIRRLEEELDAVLFVRGSRRLSLTSAGAELLPYARESIGSADEGVRAVTSLASLDGGSATFGILRNADYYLLGDLVQNFHRRYPAVRVRLVGQNSAETAASISAGEIEAGLIVLPVDDGDLLVTPLIQDEVLYASADPANTEQPVTIEQFARRRLVLYDAHFGWKDPTRRQLADRAQLAGVRIDPMIEIEHVEAALKLVAAGIGDTVVSASLCRTGAWPPGLHTTSLSEPLFDTIAFARKRGRPMSRATRELARLAEDAIRQVRGAIILPSQY